MSNMRQCLHYSTTLYILSCFSCNFWIKQIDNLEFYRLCEKTFFNLRTNVVVSVPVEIHFVDFRVVVFNLGMRMVNKDSEIGQASLHWECLGKAGDVIANAIHQILYTCETH